MFLQLMVVIVINSLHNHDVNNILFSGHPVLFSYDVSVADGVDYEGYFSTIMA